MQEREKKKRKPRNKQADIMSGLELPRAGLAPRLVIDGDGWTQQWHVELSEAPYTAARAQLAGDETGTEISRRICPGERRHRMVGREPGKSHQALGRRDFTRVDQMVGDLADMVFEGG